MNYAFKYSRLIPVLICGLICSCNEKKISADVGKPNKKESHLIQMDSASLYASLYNGKTVLSALTHKGFDFNIEFFPEKQLITIRSGAKSHKDSIEYLCYLKFHGDVFEEEKFNFYDEEIYEYTGSAICFNGRCITLDSFYFENFKSQRVYPAGFWHGSLDGAAMKHYHTPKMQVVLLNGVDLYCNGFHCSSYQMYVMVKTKDDFHISIFDCEGSPPYSFDMTHLVESEVENVLEFYLPVRSPVKEKGDFDVYYITSKGVHLKK